MGLICSALIIVVLLAIAADNVRVLQPRFNTLMAPAAYCAALVAFLDRAMAKDADARFQTGDEFAQALRACVGTQKPQVDITI